MHYIYKFLSIFLTNVYKTSINTTSLEMDMPALITPRPRLNPVVPLVANGILVAEIEKLHVKLDAVSVDIARVSNIMQEVGKAEPLAPEPVAPEPKFMDVPLLIWKIEDEGRKTREYIGLWSVCVMLFIAMMHMVSTPSVNAPSPACCPECPVVSDWTMIHCFANEFVKNARDEWVRVTKK